MKFYVHHIRSSKICMSGARHYFEQRKWDWNHFLDHGRPLNDLIAQGDPFAMDVVEVVLRANKNGR